MTEEFLTTKQVSEILHLEVQTVRKLVSTGDLPGISIGKSYRIPESELIKWMYQHKIWRQSGVVSAPLIPYETDELDWMRRKS